MKTTRRIVLASLFSSSHTPRPCGESLRCAKLHILKEISPGCSLEGLMLRLKLQCFGHLMQRADSFEDSDAGKD